MSIYQIYIYCMMVRRTCNSRLPHNSALFFSLFPLPLLLKEIIQLRPDIFVFIIVDNSRIRGNETVLRSDIQRVIHFPVNVSDFSRGVKESLDGVVKEFGGSESDSHALDGVHDGLNDVRRSLEDVGPNVIEKMD